MVPGIRSRNSICCFSHGNLSILVAAGGKIDHVDAIKMEKWTVGEISRSLYVFNFIKSINDIHTSHKYIFQLQALAGQMFTFT